jgi:hypothetical protein
MLKLILPMYLWIPAQKPSTNWTYLSHQNAQLYSHHNTMAITTDIQSSVADKVVGNKANQPR